MFTAVALLCGTSAQPFYPKYGGSRIVSSLNGEWSFGFDAAFEDALRPLDPSSVKTPETASVPSAFDVTRPGLLGRRGTAFYRRSFSLQPHSRGLLHFAACSFFCRVWVDGAEVAQHFAGGYVPFWAEVPPSASANRTLVVLSDNRFNGTTAPVHTGGDFYMFGGLTRDVILHALPPSGAYVAFLGVLPLNTTHVNVSVELSGGIAGAARERVLLSFDQYGTTAATLLAPPSGGVRVTAGHIAVPMPKAWSPASPHLHTLTAAVASSSDAATARFGLRTIGVTPTGRFKLNGAALFLHGVNRHTMTAPSGSALSLSEVEDDVALLKSLNANYVRGAHYPQDQRFLDLCDEAGLLVWEEALGPDVRTGNIKDARFMRAQLAQVSAMVDTSYSHPSVILHGFFNEGPSTDPAACVGYNASASAIRALVPRTHRMVTWASSSKEKDLCFGSADVLAFNEYPGWYTESFETVNQTWAGYAAWAADHYPSKPFLVSETGGGALWEWRNGSGGSGKRVIMNYTVATGALAAGGDLEVMHNSSWEEGVARCNASGNACAGLTFKSQSEMPRGAKLTIYLKRVAHVNSDDDWVYWVKGSGEAARPPKWSQEYQAELVGADVAAAISLRHVSGISVWQFSDIKADDGANSLCGGCEYTSAYDPSTPMNCSHITPSCWRPGGENHKGLVDLWRRPKLAYHKVKGLYAGVK